MSADQPSDATVVDDTRKPAKASAAGRVVRRAAAGAWDDDIFTESASAAFWQTLSLPPLLLGLFGILGYVGGWFGPTTVADVEHWIVTNTSAVFAPDAGRADHRADGEPDPHHGPRRGRVDRVPADLWSGSSAMSSFVDAITRAHDQYERRNLVWQRCLAVLMYVVALCSGIVLLPIAAVGPGTLLALLPAVVQPLSTASSSTRCTGRC
jgi:membrane protein